MKKNEITVEKLRKSGVHVEIYHGRVHLPNNNNAGDSEMMSRRDAKLTGLDKTHTVFCKGGFTRVELTSPNGEKVIGKYNFNNRHFNRLIGLRAALGRAIKQFK